MIHSSSYLRKTHSTRRYINIIDFISKSSDIKLLSLPQLYQYRYTSTDESNRKTQNEDTKSEKRKVCLIIGAGPGVGGALIRRYAKEGYIAVASRRDINALQRHINQIERDMEQKGETYGMNDPNHKKSIIPYPCDARQEMQVVNMFEDVEKNIGEISVCIFNVGANISFPILKTTSKKFYNCWEMACYSGFLVGREAAKYMVPREKGTIIFTGATASKRGAANFSAFSVAKSGLRALSQSLAREIGPKGVHVSHVIIDGAIDTPWIRQNFKHAIAKIPKDGICDPDHIADAYWHLTCQHKSAWTHEMDLRPFCERF